jgi:hypothetical protein
MEQLSNTLLNGSFTFSQDENMNFIYKAQDVPFKKSGSLRKPYADLPRFKVIIEAEKKFTDDYDQLLVEGIKQISTILNSFGH